MKEFFKRFFKSKLNIVIIVLLGLVILTSALSPIDKVFVFMALLLLSATCFVVVAKVIVDYKSYGRKLEEQEFHAANAREVSCMERGRKKTKRDVVFRVIMFILFGLLFLVATVKVY